MEAIRIEALRKVYKDVCAVDDLDLIIEKGELFSLLGINGAGKTTTIRILCGLTEATSGEAYINGKSVKSHSAEVKRMIAVSPQETAVAPGLSAKENLQLMCGAHGFDAEKSRNKIEELSEQFGLSEIMNKKAGKLSGGWKRRLSIAMALISEPEVLFLDEPTLGLDVIARSELWDIIRSMKGKVTIVLTTHYMEEAENLSDRVGIMKSGKLLACSTVQEIKKLASTESFEEAFVRIVKGESK